MQALAEQSSLALKLRPSSDITPEDLQEMRSAAKAGDRNRFSAAVADAWAKGSTSYNNFIHHFKRHSPGFTIPHSTQTRMKASEAAQTLHYARVHIADLRSSQEFRQQVAILCKRTNKSVESILSLLEREQIFEPGARMSLTIPTTIKTASPSAGASPPQDDGTKKRRAPKNNVAATTMVMVKDAELCFASAELAVECGFNKQDIKPAQFFSSKEEFQRYSDEHAKQKDLFSLIRSLNLVQRENAVKVGLFTKEAVDQAMHNVVQKP